MQHLHRVRVQRLHVGVIPDGAVRFGPRHSIYPGTGKVVDNLLYDSSVISAWTADPRVINRCNTDAEEHGIDLADLFRIIREHKNGYSTRELVRGMFLSAHWFDTWEEIYRLKTVASRAMKSEIYCIMKKNHGLPSPYQVAVKSEYEIWSGFSSRIVRCETIPEYLSLMSRLSSEAVRLFAKKCDTWLVAMERDAVRMVLEEDEQYGTRCLAA